MKRSRLNRILALLLPALVVGSLAVQIPVAAQDTPLPSADTVLSAYIQATGGQAAYDDIKNRYMKSKMEIPAQGVSMSISVWMAQPNRMYSLVESDIMGKIESGTDGEIAWRNSLMTGPQILKGAERDQVFQEATMDRMVHWKEHFTSTEVTAVSDVNGKPAYKVEMTPKVGPAQTCYFDKESKLMVKLEMTAENPMGKIPVEVFPEDYREAGGIVVAHKIVSKMMGMETIMTIEEMQNNIEMPEDRFNFPAEIQALLDKEAAPAEEAAEAPAAAPEEKPE